MKEVAPLPLSKRKLNFKKRKSYWHMLQRLVASFRFVIDRCFRCFWKPENVSSSDAEIILYRK